MTRNLAGLGVVLIAWVAIGCDAPRKKPAATAGANNVLDVAPAPARATAKPVHTPTAQPPTGLPPSDSITYRTAPGTYASAQPVSVKEVSAPPSSTSATPGAGKYKVKPGDTLFSIARVSYGSGKQWDRIASANPGLSPKTLKAGQTITIP